MERDSFIYKTRRKIQALAYYVMPHKFLSKLYYEIYLHEKLNLDNPTKLNEKLQWLKLNYYAENPLVVQCADKYAVRSYVEACGYKDKLTRLLGVWEKGEDVDWDKLPDQFVLKCNHGCAYNIICNDKNTFNKNKAIVQLNKWLKENFAAFNVELHYEKIKPRRIICEEYLGEHLIDYKFFCFNGNPKFFYVSTDLIHDRRAKIGFFNIDGSKIPLVRNDYEDIGNIKIPKCFPEMFDAAKKMSKEFPFVRVDFFLIGSDFKFAELTFTPGACMMPFNPQKYDEEWGGLLEIDWDM